MNPTTTRPPADWPEAGPIDLSLHDRPHESASLEWWYVHAHLQASTGAKYVVFAAFFRCLRRAEHAADEPTHFHALTYRITNLDSHAVITSSLLEDTVMGEMRDRLATAQDMPFMRRALIEQLDLGQIPLPDRLMRVRPQLPMDRLVLDMDGQRFEKLADGRYRLSLCEASPRARLVLDFELLVPVVRHGDDGVVRGVGAEEMFYYFCPRCEVTGTLELDGTHQLTGLGWYDHEFGYVPECRRKESENAKVGWNWIAMQLDTGWQITAYDLFDVRAGGDPVGHWLIAVDPDVKRHTVREFTFTPEAFWTSARTFTRWPTRWRLAIPELGIELCADAPLASEEFQTLLAPPAFWEGRVDLSGTQHGIAITGRGFVERHGLGVQSEIQGFLSDVGEETREQLRALLPTEPTAAHATRLVSRQGYEQPMDQADRARLGAILVAPVRHVVELGGKAWRSYALLACIDLVGGDSQQFMNWLVLPELVHTGSLIVDDVQDGSEVRRKGKAAHVVWGMPLAINAGTAAYFWGQHVIEHSALSAADKVKVYEIFFHTMRAAHAGQAFDIAGHHDLLDAVVRSGDGRALERRVRQTHLLKSAVPAGSLARIGVVLGGGSDAQQRALGGYFETLGVAFQIMDDILNLDGFEPGLKQTGEDLREAKVTFPVARAFSETSGAGRQALAALLRRPTRTESEVADGIALIRDSGALASSRTDAQAMVEDAWRTLSPHLVDSDVKVRLRALSWFLLDRHY
jgi:geranylgeranyl pyrophosphate synthase/predicted secreted hydrolase